MEGALGWLTTAHHRQAQAPRGYANPRTTHRGAKGGRGAEAGLRTGRSREKAQEKPQGFQLRKAQVRKKPQTTTSKHPQLRPPGVTPGPPKAALPWWGEEDSGRGFLSGLFVGGGLRDRRWRTRIWKVLRRKKKMHFAVKLKGLNGGMTAQRLLFQFCLFMCTFCFSARVRTPDAFWGRGSCLAPPSGDRAS